MPCNDGRIRILVADDDAGMAQRLTHMLLASDGLAVIGPAADGAEAARLFHEHAPEAAVLDFEMPHRSGLSVLREIRTTGSACLVIILTNHQEPAFREACLEAGADHFLSKADGLERIPELVRATHPAHDAG